MMARRLIHTAPKFFQADGARRVAGWVQNLLGELMHLVAWAARYNLHVYEVVARDIPRIVEEQPIGSVDRDPFS
jgi:hypothetical protein